MFCKPPHPVYIVLFRGDDTDFVGNQEIVVKITTERDISGCKAYFKYMGNIQTFDEIPENKELHLVFSREQTKEMPLGTWDAELYLIDENGKRMTVNNRIHMLVTNSVREAYFPDDTQAVSVVISANKYIEDAEVSADGKTLTLTKKDGTEVSFSGGGGSGGTNDYNELENKPSINGTTLTGNVNLATPEQLSLKADKTGVYTKAEVDDKVDAVGNKADAAYSAAESLADGVNSLADTIGTHIRNTKNPHKVTAAQVGALPIIGGTLTGDLAVGKEHTASQMLTVASESDANGITLQGGKSNGNGSRVFVGGSTGSGGSIIIEGGGAIGGRLYVGGISGAGGGAIEVSGMAASIKKNDKEVATEEQVNAKADKTDVYTKAEVDAKGYVTAAITNGLISASNQTFSNAVLAVGLNIDTNSVAVLNEIASTFGGFPVEGTATTVGGLLAALAAAVAWLKKNKVGSFASVGGASATVENGVAKLDDFFTESNSLLIGTIKANAGGDDEKTLSVFSTFARMDDFTTVSDESDSFDIAITKLSQLLGEDVAA